MARVLVDLDFVDDIIEEYERTMEEIRHAYVYLDTAKQWTKKFPDLKPFEEDAKKKEAWAMTKVLREHSEKWSGI